MPSPNSISNPSDARVRRKKRKRHTMWHRFAKWITAGQRLRIFIILTTLLIAATAIGYIGSHWDSIQQTFPKRMVLSEIATTQHYYLNKMIVNGISPLV
jgi:hypothetical protein